MIKIKNETSINIFHKSISTFKTFIPKRRRRRRKKSVHWKQIFLTKSLNNHTLLFQTRKASSFSSQLSSSLRVFSSKCKQARGKKILHGIKHLIFIGRNKKGTKKGERGGGRRLFVDFIPFDNVDKNINSRNEWCRTEIDRRKFVRQ